MQTFYENERKTYFSTYANLPTFIFYSLLSYFSATCLSQESYDNKVDKAFWWSLLGL